MGLELDPSVVLELLEGRAKGGFQLEPVELGAALGCLGLLWNLKPPKTFSDSCRLGLGEWQPACWRPFGGGQGVGFRLRV